MYSSIYLSTIIDIYHRLLQHYLRTVYDVDVLVQLAEHVGRLALAYVYAVDCVNLHCAVCANLTETSFAKGRISRCERPQNMPRKTAYRKAKGHIFTMPQGTITRNMRQKPFTGTPHDDRKNTPALLSPIIYIGKAKTHFLSHLFCISPNLHYLCIKQAAPEDGTDKPSCNPPTRHPRKEINIVFT